MFAESNYQFSILPKLVASGTKLTPMMEQYYQIKKDYLQAIVLFRMGDFFEVFFEDAELLSKILNITLTTRGSIEDVAIPMAGIPHHAISNYIEKLSSEGIRVVICDQIEDPKMSKGIVKRAVTQIIGPGIPFDIDRLNGKAQCFLACAHVNEDQSIYTLILVDYTHGDFFAINCPTKASFQNQLQLYKPKEIITYKNQWTHSSFLSPMVDKTLDFFQQENILQTNIAQDFFSSSQAKTYISKVAPYYFNDSILLENKNLIFPLTALCYYLTATQQKNFIKHLRPLRLINLDKFMKVSTQTLEGLNILGKNSWRYGKAPPFYVLNS